MPVDFDAERVGGRPGGAGRRWHARAGAAVGVVEGERFEQFTIDARDFLSARERGGTTGTSIEQASAAL